MRPAMIATWSSGLLLVRMPGVVAWRADGWIYVKLAAVLGLTWFHHWLAAAAEGFRGGPQSRYRAGNYRLMNELPTLALLVIVIMVIVRPF